jgi:hypothetical protein
MSTATKTRKRVKPERRIRIIKPIQDGIGAIQIVIGGEPHNYLVRALASDFGRAFNLIKQEVVPVEPGVWEEQTTASYNVCLDGARSTCDCLGFLKHHHCKHVEGLAALAQSRKLPAPRAEPAENKLMEPCGFCSGRGFVYGSMYDDHGYQRHDEPPQVTCEYCGGSGACVDGGLLLPATQPALAN